MPVGLEIYRSLLEGKNHEELMGERNRLIDEIKEYEEKSDDPLDRDRSSSGTVLYKYNHLYLSEVCELLSHKTIPGDLIKEENSSCHEWLYILREYLLENNLLDLSINDSFQQRKDGREFSLSDHVKGLVYSLLSNQRPWKVIASNKDKIDKIFYDYDLDKIKGEDPEKFIGEIRKIKCGNRDISQQMKSLAKNILIMEEIESDYGSMDKFVSSAPPYEIVNKLSNHKSKYKLNRVGEALAWEYLKNVGIDGMKPDLHLCRFFSGDRMGSGNKTPGRIDQVYESVLKLSKATGFSMSEIDLLVWSFCASGYGEICSSDPRCEICPIREYCNRGIKGIIAPYFKGNMDISLKN